MADHVPLPCPNCDSTTALKSKWNSETRKGWVHCDGCGFVGDAVDLTDSTKHPIVAWNSTVRKARSQ